MNNNLEIKVGQIWKDCDKRRCNRFIFVKSVEGNLAKCQNLRTSTVSRINIDRLTPGPYGYVLVWDPELVPKFIEHLIQAAARRR